MLNRDSRTKIEFSPISSDFQKFDDEISSEMAEQRTRIAKVGEAMARILDLSVGFAAAMLVHEMPVTVAIEEEVEEPDISNSFKRGIRSRKLVPLWVTLRNTNLSDQPLRVAHTIHETCSYSLLSGTPNNFRDVYTEIDPDKLDELKLGYKDEISYFEQAIGVTPSGINVPLSRSYRGDKLWRRPWESEQYRIIQKELAPADLFDTESHIDPADIERAMEARLKESLKYYQGQMNNEMANNEIDREADYYFPKFLEVDPKESEQSRKRKWFRGK